MATKQIHTHRGHCQLCASVQAINTQTGIIAKHGYTRDGGYFSGTCPGSDHMNLHVARDLADAHITDARREMTSCRNTAASYFRRESHPTRVWGGEMRLVYNAFKTRMKQGVIGSRWEVDGERQFSYLKDEEILVAWDDATPEYQEEGRALAIESLEERAKRCEDYANHLEGWANRITGKVDPYQLRDLEPIDWAVGDTVHIGGKKGYSAVVEAVEVRPYATFGCRRGRTTVDVKHVRVTRPAITEKRVSEKAGGYVIREARPAKVVRVAMRDIKERKPNPLADELKAAGLL